MRRHPKGGPQGPQGPLAQGEPIRLGRPDVDQVALNPVFVFVYGKGVKVVETRSILRD